MVSQRRRMENPSPDSRIPAHCPGSRAAAASSRAAGRVPSPARKVRGPALSSPSAARAGKASGRDGEAIRVVLEGLSEGIVRLKLHFYMKTERCLVVEAEDLGFGEFRASSGRTWKDEIQIYQETDRWG